ncbi:hypothetical protein LZ31DRAFT_192534 [Colletotrichum somersetense]|nr:hypothetical protein LZ31DRAFT_192534 [Colletotrichum somersetense]
MCMDVDGWFVRHRPYAVSRNDTVMCGRCGQGPGNTTGAKAVACLGRHARNEMTRGGATCGDGGTSHRARLTVIEPRAKDRPSGHVDAGGELCYQCEVR